MQEVFIGMLCFFVSLLRQGILSGKTLSLINRVVQLRISIAHLPSIDIQLKPFYLGGIVRLFLGKRTDLNRVIHDKSRLYHLVLAVFVEE